MIFLKLGKEILLAEFSLLEFEFFELLELKLLDEVGVMYFCIDKLLDEWKIRIFWESQPIWPASVH